MNGIVQVAPEGGVQRQRDTAARNQSSFAFKVPKPFRQRRRGFAMLCPPEWRHRRQRTCSQRARVSPCASGARPRCAGLVEAANACCTGKFMSRCRACSILYSDAVVKMLVVLAPLLPEMESFIKVRCRRNAALARYARNEPRSTIVWQQL